MICYVLRQSRRCNCWLCKPRPFICMPYALHWKDYLQSIPLLCMIKKCRKSAYRLSYSLGLSSQLLIILIRIIPNLTPPPKTAFPSFFPRTSDYHANLQLSLTADPAKNQDSQIWITPPQPQTDLS
jgi:hypothetical protein